MRKNINAALVITLLSICCDVSAQAINKAGKTIIERFIPPSGYTRAWYPDNSFQKYIRTYSLKKYGAPIRLHTGAERQTNIHVSVFDFPLLKQDLIQCADAVIKLRASYLYSQNRYDEISFSITNGMKVPFSQFTEGYRVAVEGAATKWVAGYNRGSGQDVFDEYLFFIYQYAGTYSLLRDLKKKSFDAIEVGDVFIYGALPGHIVMVVDMACKKETNEKIMLLAQSYMPSQEFHILKSYSEISPWYYARDGVLVTPDWTFYQGSLAGF